MSEKRHFKNRAKTQVFTGSCIFATNTGKTMHRGRIEDSISLLEGRTRHFQGTIQREPKKSRKRESIINRYSYREIQRIEDNMGEIWG